MAMLKVNKAVCVGTLHSNRWEDIILLQRGKEEFKKKSLL
jgi:hypothetical protein